MGKKMRGYLIILIIISLISCNKEKDMRENRSKKFLKILTEQAKIKNFEKQHIDLMINRLHRIPYYKMKTEELENIVKVKEEINKEYKDYKIIYSGRFNSRDIVLIGKKYKYKSCLKWGALYDVTDKKIIKVGEFNNKGLFFYTGKEKDIYKYKEEAFYVVMFKTNMTFRDILAIDKGNVEEFIKYNPEFKEDLSIKMDILITDTYFEGFVYGMGYVWWYNKKSKKWKWLIINTWY